MQFEQLESEKNRVVLGNAWEDILSQVPHAAAHACRRAEGQGRDPGPHHSRGRCGCHVDNCSVFRAHERQRAITISAEYREEASKTALTLAARVMNHEMVGPRRIDGVGMWPAVSSAAAETVQARVALPEAGVAFRAPSGNNNLAVAAVQQVVVAGPAEPWPFQWTDPFLGAPRPLKLAMEWRVHQIERGRSRAWMHPPSAERGPDLNHYERRACLGTVLEVEPP